MLWWEEVKRPLEARGWEGGSRCELLLFSDGRTGRGDLNRDRLELRRLEEDGGGEDGGRKRPAHMVWQD